MSSAEPVQTMCRTNLKAIVPFTTRDEEKEQLKVWALKKGGAGIKEYWLEKNQISLDGKPTHINDKNA